VGRHRILGLVPTVAALSLVGCGGTDWVEITGAQASAPDARTVMLLLDYCHPAQVSAPTENVIETPTEIRITVAMRITSGDRDACAGIATIELDTAIGSRTVVDERTGRRFDVVLGTPEGAPAPTTTSSGPSASGSSSPERDAPAAPLPRW
jgi:hypothetical protein